MENKHKLILLLDEAMFSHKLIYSLLEKFDENDLLFNLDKIQHELISVVGESCFCKLKNAICLKKIEKIASKLNNFNVGVVFYDDKEYPQKLLNISCPPPVIYYKGDVVLLNKKSIAIVGTRRPTVYGRETTKLFATKLSEAGLVTVSGLAYGLDMEVAVSTLEARGKTIAVLGGGLDEIYPSQNTNLANKIVDDGGLLISLHPPGRKPTKYSFVERNRIISGLSLGTIIIEAGESSGTLNTANHTIEQGRELFVVPANINSVASKGSNKLIEELPETFTIRPERVLKVLNIKTEENKSSSNVEIADIEKNILNLLYEKDLDFDQIQEQTKIESKTLISLLTMMEINGLIKKLPGNFYSL